MSKVIDARGLSCPQPVIEAKKALAASPEALEVLVDNRAACENVTRFAENAGRTVTAAEDANGDYTLRIGRAGAK